MVPRACSVRMLGASGSPQHNYVGYRDRHPYMYVFEAYVFGPKVFELISYRMYAYSMYSWTVIRGRAANHWRHT